MASSRFVTVNAEDIVRLEESSYSQKTKYNDDYAERLLTAFIQTSNTSFPTSKSELDSMLRLFFASVRTKKGELFSRGGLTGIYQALSRVINRRFDVDIRTDPALSKSRSILKSMKAHAKKMAKGWLNTQMLLRLKI
jgi:hypothetical protein